MASDGERCGGLGSFLAMSCRGRAEAFARRLHSKLKSLGTHDDNESADESSWLAANENPITLSQPAHSSNPEQFLDLDMLESPGSPEEELEEVDLNVLNKDTLHTTDTSRLNQQTVQAQVTVLATTNNSTNDSDSDGTFYDTEDKRLLNHTNGIDMSDNEMCINSQESDYSSQQMLSISEDTSMLSFKEDELSLDVDTSLSDAPKCNGDVSDNSNVRIIISDDISVDTDRVYPSENQDSHLLTENNVDDDKEEEEEDIQQPRVRRSTSLKSGKTPPGTPGQKKFVRFADALGLDLADVRTFMDDIPKIPTSAYEDLDDVDFGESISNEFLSSMIGRTQPKAEKYLLPMFQQPVGLPNFLDLVREHNVCLENVFVEDPISLSLKGTVRVRNLDFHKSVHIRYTLDSWQTFADVKATYVDNSCDGFSDKFTFLLYAHTLSIGQKLEMACRFQCRGCQYWDNNGGSNYCFQCLPVSHSTTSTTNTAAQMQDEWTGASFY
ncbi:glycogen-binding subunit 76A [Diorhabda carinulata]|uniref:glycogen-binding subunit 76A n=1 Tax=Diorhabda carinulata TaxID=1163345 RepID=UPI0025A052A0|nr:glycogen-binding subunit 76A [Diorhabda carinulata]XP_057652558.1 glycogen-binding subunit 76A [Diorhabda carinulata]